jgi:predicted RNase H-like HicB family nuclease
LNEGPGVAEAPRTYTAVFELAEPASWEVGLLEDRRLRGFGSSLDEARANLREVMGFLFGGGEGSPERGVAAFELIDDVRLPPSVSQVVEQARVEREMVRQLRTEAGTARKVVAGAIAEAARSTRRAARLVAEYAEWLGAQAKVASPPQEIRFPPAVVDAMEAANTAVATVNGAQARCRSTQETAKAAEREALATNRRAAWLLVEHCRLTVPEGGRLLGLPTDRVEWLVNSP